MAAGSQEPRGCYSCCAFIQSQECSATAAGAPSYPVLRWPDENKEKGLKVHFKGYTTKAGEEKMCTYRVEIGGIVQYINVDTILKWANLWSEHGGNIPKFTVTQDLDESDIRVQLADKGGSWSEVGRVATAKGTDTTMVLNLHDSGPPEADPSDFRQFVVVHEFGHALGLGHEHQSSHLANALDYVKTIQWLMKTSGLSEDNAEKKFKADFRTKAGSGIRQAPTFDASSIMCYPIGDECFVKPVQALSQEQYRRITSMCYSNRKEPSEGDLQTIVTLYEGGTMQMAQPAALVEMKTLTAADNPASMTEIIHFQGNDNKIIDISDLIGRKYTRFGTLILKRPNSRFDPDIASIAWEQHNSVRDTNFEILTRWIRGEGIEDRTWRGLIRILRAVDLNSLADYIAEAKDKYKDC